MDRRIDVTKGVKRAIRTRFGEYMGCREMLKFMDEAIINVHQRSLRRELVLIFSSLRVHEAAELARIFNLEEANLFGGLAEGCKYKGVVELSGFIELPEARLLMQASE
ncbi:MAG: hypothetical protein ACYS30_22730 [Planctomycetota bacterium]|jgi:hypothetical protein